MTTELERAIAVLREALAEEGTQTYTVASAANKVNAKQEVAQAALEYLADRGELIRFQELVCPCGEARRADESGPCPRCGEEDAQPQPERRYRKLGLPTRDVRWVLLLHGMNTVGAWQEELTWRLAQLYGYSVPVAIYKYGIVRPGAILRFRQRALRDDLRRRIQALSGQAAGSGFGGKPDVIAHSLGTWLLAEVLHSDPSVRLGRVVLVGCIVRPDFDWQSLRQSGQVEEVLCHYSRKDFWAKIAHYVIPGSGPAGVRGFNDRATVAHQTEVAFGHSDYFADANLGNCIETIWKPFLTARSFPRQEPDMPGWTESTWLLRATLLRFLILALVGGLVVLLGTTVVLGFQAMF